MGRLIRLVLWAVIFVTAGVLYMLWHPQDDLPLPYEFKVREGESLRQIARELADQGAIDTPWLLVALGRLTGQANHIKPGIYRVEQRLTVYGLLHKMAIGDRLLLRISFIEGWSWPQVRALLAAQTYLVHDSAKLDDKAVIQALGLPAAHPEGQFFPDTYVVEAGVSDLDVLRQAQRAMQVRLTHAWEKRAPDLFYRSPYEALIMASIVEKETGKAAERPQIARVFVNRMRIGMPLQTDPTVIYGLGSRFDGNLRRKDLQTDTPYNTYTRRGLPPTPIAMPGAAALEAALHPADSKALYFVAKGDSSHQFSETLEAHNRAVNTFQRHQR